MSFGVAFQRACTEAGWSGAVASHLRNRVKLGSAMITLEGKPPLVIPIRVDADTNELIDIWETFSDMDFTAKWYPADSDTPFTSDDMPESSFARCFDRLVAQPGSTMSMAGSDVVIWYSPSFGFQLRLNTGLVHRACFPARFARAEWTWAPAINVEK